MVVMRTRRYQKAVRTIQRSNRQRAFLREFLSAAHRRSYALRRSPHRWWYIRSQEDIDQSLQRIGDVAEASGVGAEHAEESFARGEQEGERLGTAGVDVVGGDGEDLPA
jgi:hypothetical protein